MFYVYVLRSMSSGSLYTGYTNNLDHRLAEHNAGHTVSIRLRGPYEIIYTENYKTRIEAIRRERFLKSGVGREVLRLLLPQ